MQGAKRRRQSRPRHRPADARLQQRKTANARARAQRRGAEKGERAEEGEGAGARRAGSWRVVGRRAPLLPGCTVCPSRRSWPRYGARRERHRTRARGVCTPGVSRRRNARARGRRTSGGRRGWRASEPEGLAVQRRLLPRLALWGHAVVEGRAGADARLRGRQQTTGNDAVRTCAREGGVAGRARPRARRRRVDDAAR